MSEPLRVLVADDSLTAATMLKKSLQRRGHEVTVVKDGVELVEAVYRRVPDLVVSDIMMPRLNGYQVCRLLKDDESIKNLPIVLLTGLEARADHYWGMKSGADLYLTKGNDADGLVRDIEQFIDARNIVPQPRESAAIEAVRPNDDITGRVIKLLDERLFEYSVINEIGELVRILDDYQKIVFSVLDIISRVIEFDLGIVVLVDEEQCEYYMLGNGTAGEGFVEAAKKRVNDHLLREKIFMHLPSHAEVYSRTAATTTATATQLNNNPPNAELISKLGTKEVNTGALALFTSRPEGFNARRIHNFTIIKNQADIVINFSRLYESNKQLSITDGLTKVYNHRYFQETLRREFARSARHRSSLALALLDIDHFKQVNDSRGHQQGDVILSELAKLLKRAVRSLDVVSRYGGEEFTVLMPDADPDSALKVADRLRSMVESHEFPGMAPGAITVSIGVAFVPHALVCNPQQMVNAADQALYEAKRTGRNRVIAAFEVQ